MTRKVGPAQANGFTLLEMLVALAVFSLAALALIRLQGISIRTTADLDTRIVAQAVARNLMVELQSDPAPPSAGEAEGDLENGGRRWHWTRRAVAMEDPRLLRIDLTVAPSGGGSPAVLTFLRVVE